MNAQALEIYEIFKKSLSEKEAKAVVSYFEDAKDKEITMAVERKLEHLATSSELLQTSTDLERLITNKVDNLKMWFIGIGISVIGSVIACLVSIILKA